jgi:hypothetical protein
LPTPAGTYYVREEVIPIDPSGIYGPVLVVAGFAVALDAELARPFGDQLGNQLRPADGTARAASRAAESSASKTPPVTT